MPCRTPPQSPSRLSNKETDNDAYLNLPRRAPGERMPVVRNRRLGAAQLRRSNIAPLSVDLAVTYTPERGELAPGNCGCFWLQGAGADAALTFWKGLAIAASFNSGNASNIAPNVSLKKLQFTAGPRYSYTAWTGRDAAANRSLQLFGQGLLAAFMPTMAPSLLRTEWLTVPDRSPSKRAEA